MEDTALIVRREIEVEASPEQVWPYIATAEGYRRWSCPTAEIHEVTLEPRPGGRFDDRMVVQGRVFHGTGEVAEYDPPRRIVFRTRSVEGHLTPIVDTITITLTPIDGRTRVVVEHAGFEQLPTERQEQARRVFDEGWTRALAALRMLAAPTTGDRLRSGTAEGFIVHKEIEIEAPPDCVWPYVATQEGMRRWWDAPNLLLETRVGGALDSRGLHGGTPYHHIGIVQVYDSPQTFIFTLREDMAGGGFWPEDSVIAITLEDLGGRTRVVVEHDFARLPDGLRERMVSAYRGGWTDALMEHLRRLATEHVT